MFNEPLNVFYKFYHNLNFIKGPIKEKRGKKRENRDQEKPRQDLNKRWGPTGRGRYTKL